MILTTLMLIREKRICPECKGAMTLAHKGQFSTVYVCPGCGSMLTIPPPEPATGRRE
jgi:ribosomal protein L37AE/L43A